MYGNVLFLRLVRLNPKDDETRYNLALAQKLLQDQQNHFLFLMAAYEKPVDIPQAVINISVEVADTMTTI